MFSHILPYPLKCIGQSLIFNSSTVKIVELGVLKGTQLINCGIGACFQIESHELHEGQERKC